MVVRDNLNFHIRNLLKDSYEKWESDEEQFKTKRQRDLADFFERRRKEADAFVADQKRDLQRLRQQLDSIGESYDAPGKPIKKGSRFGWG
jgi:hypothetical protein